MIMLYCALIKLIVQFPRRTIAPFPNERIAMQGYEVKRLSAQGQEKNEMFKSMEGRESLLRNEQSRMKMEKGRKKRNNQGMVGSHEIGDGWNVAREGSKGSENSSEESEGGINVRRLFRGLGREPRWLI
jgi:uncharacterized small protein (DUF1192 family)